MLRLSNGAATLRTMPCGFRGGGVSLPQEVYPDDSFDTVQARGTGVHSTRYTECVGKKYERCGAARKGLMNATSALLCERGSARESSGSESSYEMTGVNFFTVSSGRSTSYFGMLARVAAAGYVHT